MTKEEFAAMPIEEFPGVGIKRARAFKDIGIFCAEDLIRHFPRAYEHRGNVRLLAQCADQETVSLILTVSTAPTVSFFKGKNGSGRLLKFSAFDESGKCTVTFFNQIYLRDAFHVGDEFRFWGKIKVGKGRRLLTSPKFERVTGEKPLDSFVPVYPSGAGLTQKLVRDTVKYALEELKKYGAVEYIPQRIKEEWQLSDIVSSLIMLHHPQSYEDISCGRSYFSYEELYLFALGLSVSKGERERGRAPLLKKTDMTPFISLLPYELTGAQKKAINEIYSDMCLKKPSDLSFASGVSIKTIAPMARLVCGDVGSGKTVVAAAAIYISLKNGYQAAMMAPTEILARQHFDDLSPMLGKLGFRCALLTGSAKESEKRVLKKELSEGKIDVVFGTHALISSGVEFKNAGLVVTDEQHRFGVMQRARLGDSLGLNELSPHVLVMSATPIPRTLALILYGDLDISVIDEMPPGRQRVETFVVGESYRERLNAFIRKNVSEGGQVYIVCPAVEEQEDEEISDGAELIDPLGRPENRQGKDQKKMKTAVEYSKYLAETVFPELRVELMHGRMKPQEKNRVMSAFAAGDVDILVSTTVIEVGVNVPNASLMIVENAERFGLSQLHQLRGRVGRGKRKAYCVLVSGAEKDAESSASKRLEIMRTTYSGYKIAEYDLEMRGPGDFLPSERGQARQHGGFRLNMTSLDADMTRVKKVFEKAEEVVRNDPYLKAPENSAAAKRISETVKINSRAIQ